MNILIPGILMIKSYIRRVITSDFLPVVVISNFDDECRSTIGNQQGGSSAYFSRSNTFRTAVASSCFLNGFERMSVIPTSAKSTKDVGS